MQALVQGRLASEQQQQQQQLSHHKPGVAEMELDSLSITRGEEALPSLPLQILRCPLPRLEERQTLTSGPQQKVRVRDH